MTASRLRLSVLAALALALSGCHTYGVIHVDRPEVFMRERLTANRARERQWLLGKLESDPGLRFQGYRDVRTFMGFYDKFSGRADKLAGGLADAVLKRDKKLVEKGRQIDQAADPDESPEVRDPIRASQDPRVAAAGSTRTRDEGANGGKVLGFDSAYDFPPVPTPRDTVPTGADLTSLEEFQDKVAYRNAVASALREQELDDTHDLQGFTIYSLKFDISLMPPQSDSAFNELLFWRDQNHEALGKVELMLGESAHRDTINENFYRAWLASLQSSLDQEVMNLQRRLVTTGFIEEDRIEVLRYLNTIKRSQMRKARLEREKDAIIEEVRRFPSSSGIRDQELSRREQAALEELRRRYLRAELELSLFTGADDEVDGATLEQLEGLTSIRLGGRPYAGQADGALEGLARYASKLEDRPSLVSDLKGAVPFVVAEKYHDLLRGLVTLDIEEIDPLGELRLGIAQLSSKTYVLKVKPLLRKDRDEPLRAGRELAGVVALQRAMGQIQAKMKDRMQQHYVYSVEPKLYAQNISEVAASEKLMNMLAYRQGLLPEGVGLEQTSQYLRRSQTLLQGINRKPLVVGYIHGRRQFGWLLGPRFFVENEQVRYRHVPSQYSFNASIVVPAWWRSVKISGDYVWLKESGQEASRTPLFQGVEEKRERNLVEIRLPRDLSAVTTALIDHLGRGTRRPEIYADGHTYVREGDENVTMLVRGRDLWRNPKIFIGHQKADSYEVTPDMKGVVATFHKVQAPANMREAGIPVDLTVITSLGASTLRNVVTILPGRIDEVYQDPNLAVRLRSQTLTRPHPKRNSSISLELASNLLPRGYDEILLYIRPVGSPNWERLPVAGRRSVVSQNLSYVDFYFQRALWDRTWRNDWGEQRSVIFELDLRVKLRPTDRPQPVLMRGRVEGRLTYLLSADELRPALDADRLEVFKRQVQRDLTLSLRNRGVFNNYYPGFERCLSNRTAEIVIRNNKTKKIVCISMQHRGVSIRDAVDARGGALITLSANALNDHIQLFPENAPPQQSCSVSIRYTDSRSRKVREIPAATGLNFIRRR